MEGNVQAFAGEAEDEAVGVGAGAVPAISSAVIASSGSGDGILSVVDGFG